MLLWFHHWGLCHFTKCRYKVTDTHRLLGLVKSVSNIDYPLNAVQPHEIHILLVENIWTIKTQNIVYMGLWNLGDLFSSPDRFLKYEPLPPLIMLGSLQIYFWKGVPFFQRKKTEIEKKMTLVRINNQYHLEWKWKIIW